MRSTLLLAVSLALSLALGALCTESKDHERMKTIDKLLNVLTSPKSAPVVDELIKTLSEAGKDTKKQSFLQKRDMHDFFVGLMGKRNTPPVNLDVDQESASRFGSFQDPSHVE